jgi:hypothetical protein
MTNPQNHSQSATKKMWRKAIGFSSAVILSTLNVAPSFALVQSSNRLPNQPESSQLGAIKLAQFGVFGDVLRTGREIQRIEENERRSEVEAERDAIRTEREKLRLERERLRLEQDRYQFESQKFAEEEQRLEAERRRQYFDSLSPEEKKVYIQYQQALQLERARQTTEVLEISSELLEGLLNY